MCLPANSIGPTGCQAETELVGQRSNLGIAEDVVGSINPVVADEPETLTHWSVTVAVDDAVAPAAKADGLGGTVIVPPFDAPWVRLTIIGDPQGATFIASKFVPENKDLGSGAEAAV